MDKFKIILAFIVAVPFVFGGLVIAEGFDMEKASTSFESKCSKCHSTDRPKAKNKDKEGWTATVKRMQGKNPPWISDAEADTIIEYLTRAYGK